MQSYTTKPSSDAQRDRHILVRLALYVIFIHCVLFAYDWMNGFEPFFRVDRANNRVDAMHHLFAAHTWGEFGSAILTNNIIAGEYILQSALFWVGGAAAVILFQVALQLCSVLLVYRIAKLTLNSHSLSAASAFLYATLPHSLAFPHQFASEAIAVPLVIISFWLVTEYLVAEASWACLLTAGILFGAASCVRQVLMLLPACLALCVIARRRPKALRDAMALVIAGGVLPLMLLAFFFLASHQLSLGNNISGMGYNLYLRAMKIATSLPPADQRIAADRYFSGKIDDNCIGNPPLGDETNCKLSLSGYASLALHYPAATARFVARDLLTFIAKSGISSITANYLNLSVEDDRIKDDKSGWHAVWNSQGLYAAIMMVFKADPLTAILELAGSCLFLILFGCFLTGCIEVRRLATENTLSRSRIIALTAMALFPLYLFATSEVGEYTQSRYRYPGEFAICILTTLGGASVMRFMQTRSRSRPAHEL